MPAKLSPSIRKLILDFSDLHRLVAADGLQEASWGHMSARLQDEPGLTLVSPGQTHWSQVTPEAVLVFDADGQQVAGEGRPNPSAIAIHQPLLQARSDVNCIIHTHTPVQTAFTMLEEMHFETRADQNAACFHGRVSYYQDYLGVVEAEDEGAVVAGALGDGNVLFMRNHGAVVAEESVPLAYVRLWELECACKSQLLALGSGRKLHLMSEQAAASVAAYRGRDLQEHFSAMREKFKSRAGRSATQTEQELPI